MEKTNIYTKNRLVSLVIERANELNLPINYQDNMIGFGKFHKFYMFWITLKDGLLTFNIRKEYIINSSEVIRLPFIDSNEEKIFELIKNIYDDYDDKLFNGELEEDNGSIKEEDKQIKVEKKIFTEFSKTKLSKITIDFLKSLDIKDINELIKYYPIKIYNNSGIDLNIIIEIDKLIYKSTNQYNELLHSRYKSPLVGVDMLTTKINLFLDDNLINKYKEISNNILKNCNELRRNTKYEQNPFYKNSNRNCDMFADYMYGDYTYQELGDKYLLSAAYISRIVRKYLKKYKGTYSHYFNRKSISKSQLMINEELSKLKEEEYMDFFYYGFNNINPKFKEYLLSILLSESQLNKVKNILKNKKKFEKYKHKQENKMELNNNQLRELFNYPIVECKYIYEDIQEFKDGEYYNYHLLTIEKLKRLNPSIEIKILPDIVYSTYLKSDFRPDLLIKMPSGELILVIITDLIKLAVKYNKIRFEKFVEFCKKNGFGYAIMTCSLCTYEKVASTIVPNEAEKLLNELLNQNRYINWIDVQKLREKTSISTMVLASYIINNDLSLYLKPFLITNKK